MCADRVRRWVQRALVGIGLACWTWWAVIAVQTTQFQYQQRLALEQASPPPASVPTTVTSGAVIGSLDIPRLGLSAAIAEGDDAATLRVAIGHLPDTPLPWEGGNSALAAHRDTFFRPLARIRVGDRLRLSTAHGELSTRCGRRWWWTQTMCRFSDRVSDRH